MDVKVQQSFVISYLGAIIRLGRSHLFRFNDPSEAARLREEMKLVCVREFQHIQCASEGNFNAFNEASKREGNLTRLNETGMCEEVETGMFVCEGSSNCVVEGS